ncbi:MAG TPA: HalOD1 output domain-containing protein [Natronoarchaeum rubrum]|nr:HalOD1 output domain-containing protein [Natronoarchaeum rubrum]
MCPPDGGADDAEYSYVEHTDESGDRAATVFDDDNEDAWIETDTLVSLDEGDADPEAGTRFDETTGTYHVEYDWRDAMPLSMIVVMIVADLEGVGATELDPLYDYLDPELLDRLFSPQEDGRLAAGEVSFTYHDYEITVFRHGHIGVTPPAAR